MQDSPQYLKSRQELIDNQISEYGYHFCEHCQKSRGVYKFEVHHIIYRSEAPKHPYLHDKRNLIILCSDCHNGSGDSFHNNKSKRNYLIEERNLHEIFEWINIA
jgi:5-methylcytosine-specific restriction endonuclease McrA